jgi:hypothetical protein
MRIAVSGQALLCFALFATTAVGLALAQESGFRLADAPLYQSVEDPQGQQPRRILAEGGVLHFGQARDGRSDLLKSDLGFSMYFIGVDGGVRVRNQPIVFPSATTGRLDFEDFSCSVRGARTTKNVLCRSKSNGQLYHSRMVDGGLVSFDLRCFDELERVCHYELIGGRAIRPSKIEQADD